MKLAGRRILWLTDYTVAEVSAGGAEITDSYVIQAGKQLGYDIQVCRPCDLRSNVLDKSDLVIFSNCYEFPQPARQRIMAEKPYVVYSHDSGRWIRVLEKNQDMIKNAEAAVFLSPLHRDCFKKFISEEDNILLVPPHIPYTFYDNGQKRVNKIMFVGNIHQGKGVDDIINYAKKHPELIFDFYYKRNCGILLRQLRALKNCNLIGYVPKEGIYNNYNKYAYFIHIPVHQESFGRAVGEAYLCGCKLIVNERVGAMSYGWDYKTFREKTMRAHFLFWEELGKIGDKIG
jgi:glycosyltransferase involved in cell wall biosynthesis